MADNPSHILVLADNCAADGELLDALEYYNRYANIGGATDQKWYALYQAARMLDELDFNPQLTIEAYFRAYEFDPVNIDPLVQIARHCRLAGRMEEALELIKVALEPEISEQNTDICTMRRDLEYLRICLAMNEDAQALIMADQLLEGGQLSAADQKVVRALRLQASDHAQARLDIGLFAEEPVVGEARSTEAYATSQPSSIPQATSKRDKRKLCIGMATFDDYDGVYFTVQAIRMYHPEILEEVEILVVDNNPTGAAAECLKELDDVIPNYRYIPEPAVVGTKIRDRIFREANADYVLVIDCHIFIVAGAIQQLIGYFDAHSNTRDLLHGPLLHDDLKEISTHLSPVWEEGMWGSWSIDRRGEDIGGDVFDIPMQGLGLFACRKEAWPGFNPDFRGFGGEEGYIHEKVRQVGGRVLCLPFLRWMHRFKRPLGIPYQASWESRMRNYIIGWQELGLDTESIKSHFSELMGHRETEMVFARVAREQSRA